MRKSKHLVMLSFFLLLSGCSYSVMHAPYLPPTPVAATPQDLILIVPPDVSVRVESPVWGESSGMGETYNMDLGAAITDVLPKALQQYFAKVVVMSSLPNASITGSTIVKISISSFAVDFATTIFGTSECNLKLNIDVLDSNGLPLKQFIVESTGKGSGSDYKETYAGLVFSPLTRQGVCKALGAMLTNAVVDAGGKIAGQLSTASQ